MSTFGKYGVGGSLPGKWSPGPDENTTDAAAATLGTCDNTPDTKPEKTVPELKHN